MKDSPRYNAGWNMLKQVDGEAGERVVESLADIAPDFADLIIEYTFGDIYTRDGLELPLKELAVVAALTAMGNAQPQLKVHLHGALNVGCTISELTETILQISAYAGFPAALNATNALREVLSERRAAGKQDDAGRTATQPGHQQDRYASGKAELDVLHPGMAESLQATYGDLAPALVEAVVAYGYGEVYLRDSLTRPQRQIATIAALTAMGTAQSQLEFHIDAGLRVGLSVVQVREIIILMSVYAGFPASLNAIAILKRVIAQK